MTSFIRRAAVVVAAVAALVAAPSAIADAVYHSERLVLEPVGASLGSGMVVNIHPNGPQVYAHEIYALKGAPPNTQYDVTLYAGAACGVPFLALPTATFTTNGAGNGRADFKFTPEQVAPLRGMTLQVWWTVTSGSSSYRTDCTTVQLD